MLRLRVIGCLLILVVGVLANAGCSGRIEEAASSETPEIDPDLIDGQGVKFITDDGLVLVGTMYGTGSKAVVFSNMDRTQRHEWAELARALAARGYITLTYDYRGYDLSQGRPDTTLIPVDLAAAIGFARAQEIDDLALVGADLGGWAIAKISGEESPAAVVVMASRAVKDEEVQAISAPKLFVYSDEESGTIPTAMEHMFRVATEPKEQLVYPSEAHGTTLFITEHADDLRQRIASFIETHMPVE